MSKSKPELAAFNKGYLAAYKRADLLLNDLLINQEAAKPAKPETIIKKHDKYWVIILDKKKHSKAYLDGAFSLLERMKDQLDFAHGKRATL